MPNSESHDVVNVHEAKTHLSKLLQRVADGETIILAKSGKPVAKVVPFDEPTLNPKDRIGFLDGAFDIPDDFDSLGSAEMNALFHGHEPHRPGS
jgi:prevent-host-death family protein